MVNLYKIAVHKTFMSGDFTVFHRDTKVTALSLCLSFAVVLAGVCSALTFRTAP
jgi:hypothetical protein